MKITNMKINKIWNCFVGNSTYINLRWIAYIGQLIAILIVQFYLKYDFKYLSNLITYNFVNLSNKKIKSIIIKLMKKFLLFLGMLIKIFGHNELYGNHSH